MVADQPAGEACEDWCVVHHARYVVFQMAAVAVPKDLFEKILRLIDGNHDRCQRRAGTVGCVHHHGRSVSE